MHARLHTYMHIRTYFGLRMQALACINTHACKAGTATAAEAQPQRGSDSAAAATFAHEADPGMAADDGDDGDDDDGGSGGGSVAHRNPMELPNVKLHISILV